MDFKSANSLILNGKKYQKQDLLALSKTVLSNPESTTWEKAVHHFLTDWLDAQDHIKVKSSGSTGDPKIIIIKKQWMISSAIKTGKFLGLKPGDKALICLPAEFIAGKMMLVRAMVLGLDLYITPPSSIPLNNLNIPLDFAAMVPLQMHETMATPLGLKKINAIKNLIIGGAAIPKTLREKIKALTNNCYLTYGMTETVTHIAMEKLNGDDADGWMHTLSGIQVSADNLNRLIIDAPEVTDAPVLTNDIAVVKDANTFKILGRFDNMIIAGGVNIIPEELEKKIGQLIPERFVVSSLPDDRLGEQVVLVIENKPGMKYDQDKLLSACTQKLEKYQTPKKVIFLDSFPETQNHKINRKKLREKIRSINH
jgi:O-succinylbenzoic acid--CoA ligase